MSTEIVRPPALGRPARPRPDFTTMATIDTQVQLDPVPGSPRPMP